MKCRGAPKSPRTRFAQRGRAPANRVNRRKRPPLRRRIPTMSRPKQLFRNLGVLSEHLQPHRPTPLADLSRGVGPLRSRRRAKHHARRRLSSSDDRDGHGRMSPGQRRLRRRPRKGPIPSLPVLPLTAETPSPTVDAMPQATAIPTPREGIIRRVVAPLAPPPAATAPGRPNARRVFAADARMSAPVPPVAAADVENEASVGRSSIGEGASNVSDAAQVAPVSHGEDASDPVGSEPRSDASQPAETGMPGEAVRPTPTATNPPQTETPAPVTSSADTVRQTVEANEPRNETPFIESSRVEPTGPNQPPEVAAAAGNVLPLGPQREQNPAAAQVGAPDVRRTTLEAPTAGSGASPSTPEAPSQTGDANPAGREMLSAPMGLEQRLTRAVEPEPASGAKPAAPTGPSDDSTQIRRLAAADRPPSATRADSLAPPPSMSEPPPETPAERAETGEAAAAPVDETSATSSAAEAPDVPGRRSAASSPSVDIPIQRAPDAGAPTGSIQSAPALEPAPAHVRATDRSGETLANESDAATSTPPVQRRVVEAESASAAREQFESRVPSSFEPAGPPPPVTAAASQSETDRAEAAADDKPGPAASAPENQASTSTTRAPGDTGNRPAQRTADDPQRPAVEPAGEATEPPGAAGRTPTSTTRETPQSASSGDEAVRRVVEASAPEEVDAGASTLLLPPTGSPAAPAEVTGQLPEEPHPESAAASTTESPQSAPSGGGAVRRVVEASAPEEVDAGASTLLLPPTGSPATPAEVTGQSPEEPRPESTAASTTPETPQSAPSGGEPVRRVVEASAPDEAHPDTSAERPGGGRPLEPTVRPPAAFGSGPEPRSGQMPTLSAETLPPTGTPEVSGQTIRRRTDATSTAAPAATGSFPGPSAPEGLEGGTATEPGQTPSRHSEPSRSGLATASPPIARVAPDSIPPSPSAVGMPLARSADPVGSAATTNLTGAADGNESAGHTSAAQRSVDEPGPTDAPGSVQRRTAIVEPPQSPVSESRPSVAPLASAVPASNPLEASSDGTAAQTVSRAFAPVNQLTSQREERAPRTASSPGASPSRSDAAAPAPIAQRALATALPPPPPAPAEVRHALPVVQRVIEEEPTGVVTGLGPSSERGEKPTDFAEVAEKVWPFFRRKLRHERERERGLPS